MNLESLGTHVSSKLRSCCFTVTFHPSVSPFASSCLRLLVQHWRTWNLQSINIISSHVMINAPRSLVSVSVMATYGVKTSPLLIPSHERQCDSNSAIIAVSYPACVALVPVGAEKRNIAMGTPDPVPSMASAIQSRRREEHMPKVPSRISCFL